MTNKEIQQKRMHNSLATKMIMSTYDYINWVNENMNTKMTEEEALHMSEVIMRSVFRAVQKERVSNNE